MKKYGQFINEEVGFRNLKTIGKEYKTCEIFFHKDLDGVACCLAMKEFLKNFYQMKMIDCHIIQYGGLQYAAKAANQSPDNLPIIVDFANSRVGYLLFDHHDRQAGASASMGVYAKTARSNAETISGEISYSDIFTPQDIEMIRTIDSANFVTHDIKPEDVQNSIFKYEKSESSAKNRFMMGFVVNRLLLAYKNKRITVKSLNGKHNHINRNILECLAIDSNASLHSMFSNLRHYINSAKTSDKLGRLATPEEIKTNLSDYIERMKNYSFIEDPETGETTEYDPANGRHKYLSRQGAKIGKGVHYDEDYNIISQYGGGSMIKPGSYDRYVPFKNHPDANFICIVWPMGLVQVSCNPFKEKKLKDINLGEIAKEVLAKHESLLSRYYISLESVKKEFETSQDWKQMKKAEGEDYEGVGFKFTDLEAFYADCVFKKVDKTVMKVNIKEENGMEEAMNTIYSDLTDDQKTLLSGLKIPVWELIIRNSGGHPSITNISGLQFMKYNKEMMKIVYKTEKYVEVLKTIAKEFINNLKEKIDIANEGGKVEYDTMGVELKGQDTNENFEYQISGKDGKPTTVSKEEFVKAGAQKGMKTDRKSLMTIDNANKKIIAKFEKFINFNNKDID
jgi:mannitol/fructose-specific phosphotransferase system IIA component (Ntr-type)